MKNTLANVTMSPDSNAADIVEMVQAQGIAILHDFLDETTVGALNNEFDSFLETAKNEGSPALLERPELTALPVVRNLMDNDKYPATAEVFSSDLMRDISTSYLGTDTIGLNHQIYVNLNHETDSPVDQLPFLPHFDKISTFKFFVYLTDTTAQNGAMGVVPGSQFNNRKLRSDALEEFGNNNAIPNVMKGDTLLPVEGKAGTMFIFDTDVTHAAGFVQKDQQRRIMRGHTRTVELLKTLGLEKQA